jgi:hypothetical protein
MPSVTALNTEWQDANKLYNGKEDSIWCHKEPWSYTSIPRYIIMAWCFVKPRDNCTLRMWKEAALA